MEENVTHEIAHEAEVEELTEEGRARIRQELAVARANRQPAKRA